MVKIMETPPLKFMIWGEAPLFFGSTHINLFFGQTSCLLAFNNLLENGTPNSPPKKMNQKKTPLGFTPKNGNPVVLKNHSTCCEVQKNHPETQNLDKSVGSIEMSQVSYPAAPESVGPEVFLCCGKTRISHCLRRRTLVL